MRVRNSFASPPSALSDLETSSGSQYTPFSTSVNSSDAGYDPDTHLPSIETMVTPTYTSTMTSETGSEDTEFIWPLIKKIKLFLKTYILSKGLVFADLPGLRDLNAACQNVTEGYIRICHGIFAVCNIARATTDAEVEEVFSLARRANLSNMGIVCTRSDDIDLNETKRDWPRQRLRISDLQGQVAETKRKVETLNNAIAEPDDGALSAGDEEKLIDLNPLDVTDRIQRELEVLTRPDSAIGTAMQLVRKFFEEQIVDHMSQHAHQWSVSAKDKAKEWAEWHSDSYAAFCRSYGKTRTNKIGDRCWNEEAIASMTSAMNPLWEAKLQLILEPLETAQADILITFKRAFEICRCATRDESPEVRRHSSLRVLHMSMELHKKITMPGLDNLMEKYKQDLEKLRAEALSGDRSSIVGKLMEETYKACNRKSGPGCDARRKSLMRKRIRTLFQDHRQELHSRFNTLCTNLQRDIMQLLAENLSLAATI